MEVCAEDTILSTSYQYVVVHYGGHGSFILPFPLLGPRESAPGARAQRCASPLRRCREAGGPE